MGPMPVYRIKNHTNNAYKVNLRNSYVFPQKTNTMVGFEPGFFVTQVDAMTTAPRVNCSIVLNCFAIPFYHRYNIYTLQKLIFSTYESHRGEICPLST
jgi:hypothetical protein